MLLYLQREKIKDMRNTIFNNITKAFDAGLYRMICGKITTII